MYRNSAIALGLLAVFAIAACTDTPTSKSGGGGPSAGAGTQGIGRFADEEDAQTAIAAPAAEKGVVPDVIGVAAADAEEVIEEAGFKVKVEGGGVFGLTTDPSLLICTQDPAGGEEPKKGSAVTIEGQKIC